MKIKKSIIFLLIITTFCLTGFADEGSSTAFEVVSRFNMGNTFTATDIIRAAENSTNIAYGFQTERILYKKSGMGFYTHLRYQETDPIDKSSIIDWDTGFTGTHHLFGAFSFVDPFLEVGLGTAGIYVPGAGGGKSALENLSIYPFLGGGVNMNFGGSFLGIKLNWRPTEISFEQSGFDPYPMSNFRAGIYFGFTIIDEKEPERVTTEVVVETTDDTDEEIEELHEELAALQDEITELEEENNRLSEEQEPEDKGIAAIKIRGALDVEIYQGDSLEVVYDPDFARFIEVKYVGDTLLVERTGFTLEKVEVQIVIPDIERVKVENRADVEIRGFAFDHDFLVDVDGSSKLFARIETGDVEVRVGTLSLVEFDGTGGELIAEAGGSATLKLDDFTVIEADIDISGVSTAYINCQGEISGILNGAASLICNEDADTEDVMLEGLSSIQYF